MGLFDFFRKKMEQSVEQKKFEPGVKKSEKPLEQKRDIPLQQKRENAAEQPGTAQHQTKTKRQRPAQRNQLPAAERQAGTRPVNQQTSDYTVKAGDSLSRIAREFYGDANDWHKIYQANRNRIKDPNVIHPGQKIIIP